MEESQLSTSRKTPEHCRIEPGKGDSPPPEVPSIEEIQEDIVTAFEFLEDWKQRYQYIIDLGRKLSSFPEEWQIDDYKLEGCQSQVWLRAEWWGDRLHFQAISDAAIVSGLIALLLKVYSDRRPEEILATAPDFIREIGLHEHLSPTRSNGLQEMINSIYTYAQAAKQQLESGTTETVRQPLH